MNEKIKKLYDQAYVDAGGFVGASEHMNRFAELIIKECAEVANEHNSEAEGITLGVGRVIKEHFGIK